MGLRGLVDRVTEAFRKFNAPHVLCVDDDDSVRALCAAALKRAGYAVDEAVDGREARQKLEHNRYAVVLLDLAMPYLHGATLLSLLQREKPEMLQRVIVMTGMADAALIDVTSRVAAVLRKPLTIEAVVSAVCDCCASDTTMVTRAITEDRTAAMH